MASASKSKELVIALDGNREDPLIRSVQITNFGEVRVVGPLRFAEQIRRMDDNMFVDFIVRTLRLKADDLLHRDNNG